MFEKVSENVSDSEENGGNNIFARIRVAASSVIYIVMVFIVIYGIGDGVYNGFPGLVPYIIIALFLVMSFIRMYQSIIGDIPQKKKNKNRKNSDDSVKDETMEEDEVDE